MTHGNFSCFVLDEVLKNVPNLVLLQPMELELFIYIISQQ